jgi:hypothetical protein
MCIRNQRMNAEGRWSWSWTASSDDRANKGMIRYGPDGGRSIIWYVHSGEEGVWRGCENRSSGFASRTTSRLGRLGRRSHVPASPKCDMYIRRYSGHTVGYSVVPYTDEEKEQRACTVCTV